MDRKERVEQLLIANGQEHLLAHIRELDGAEQDRFFSELERVDWTIFSEEARVRPPEGEIAPIEGLKKEEIASRREEFERIGKQAVHDGKVAALMLAGGQGTRLGFDGPKGTLDIGITRPLYIYECLIRNLLEVCSACGAHVPLYIMTSQKNHDETTAFFQEHQYFGYDPAYIHFFKQDMAPSVDYNGKVMLEAKDRKEIISQTLKALPSDEALLLTLFYLEECSIEEICQITSLSTSNAKTKLFRARKHFYTALEKKMKQETVNLL